jgi:hypothetical protein
LSDGVKTTGRSVMGKPPSTEFSRKFGRGKSF